MTRPNRRNGSAPGGCSRTRPEGFDSTIQFYQAAGRSGDRLHRLIAFAEHLTEADFRPVLDAAVAEVGAAPAPDGYLLDGRFRRLHGATPADRGRVGYRGEWITSRAGVRYPRATLWTHRHGGQSVAFDGWPSLLDLFERGAIPAPAPTTPPPDPGPGPDHAAAAERAARLWAQAKPATAAHPYLAHKRVGAHGLRQFDGDVLLMPLRDAAGRLWSLQFLDAAGGKRFLRDGRTAGCFHRIGRPDGAAPNVLLIGEGYATVCAAHEATNHPGAVAHSAGNLLAVAEALRGRYPEADLILLADDDPAGRRCSEAAARAVNGRVALPPEVRHGA